MRINLCVREGDFVDTRWTTLGLSIAYSMAGSGAFDGTPPASDRWDALHDAFWSSTCSVEIDPGASLADLTAAALQAAGSAGLVSGPMGDETTSWLADAVTDKTYAAEVTVESTDLEDGDLVVLCVEHPPTALYSLMPTPNAARLFSQLQLAEAVEDAPKIRGVLLYTAADVELAAFVRTHFDELNALSGEQFQIFVHERPANWRRAKRYWKPRMRPELYRMLAALQWLKWGPYEKSDVYAVAHRFGVRLTELPCLVLFNSTGSGERFVFPLGNAGPAEFRRLFGALSETLNGERPAPAGLKRQLERLRNDSYQFAWNEPESLAPDLDRLAEAERRFRAELTQTAGSYAFRGATVIINSGGPAMTENFNFHGPTTFVNRPTDTVIRDFQNTYAAAPARQDLASLLELVLDSDELDDAGRETVAQLIHDLPNDLTTAPENARHKLERIKTTVGRAADIAAPALGIVSKILELLP
ncbi:hypothetical protein [Kribbella sp. NPDC051770]|uniref:hypothetical protein n=1 Tax=Kribbella sp. NPDC051770 TaxID=3155413 RepID=UPI00341F29C1